MTWQSESLNCFSRQGGLAMNQAISCLLLRINIILGTRKKGPGLAPGPWCVVRDYRSPTMKSSLATANPILFSTLERVGGLW